MNRKLEIRNRKIKLFVFVLRLLFYCENIFKKMVKNGRNNDKIYKVKHWSKYKILLYNYYINILIYNYS